MPRVRCFLFAVLLIVSVDSVFGAQTSTLKWTVSTIASGPEWTEGASPTGVDFGVIGGFAMGNGGVFYVSSRSHNRVYRVDGPTITLVAGIGGSSIGLPVAGDGGPARGARLNDPLGLALDSSGNLYIADSGYNRVRKVNIQGIITTFAGTGASGFSGDSGPSTAARLARPENVLAMRNGNILISDVLNHRVRAVDPSGTITTFAGDGNPAFSGDEGLAPLASLHYPRGLAEDLSARVYIADFDNRRVRMVDRNGIIRTIAGGGIIDAHSGPATNVFVQPLSVAVDDNGVVYVGESSHVRAVNPDGTATGLAGFGPGYDSVIIRDPVAIDFRSGYLFWAQAQFGVVQRMESPNVTTLAGVHADSVVLRQPTGITVDSAGNLYTSDAWNHRVWRYPPVGLPAPIPNTALPSYVPSPAALAVGPDGNTYVSDGGGRVWVSRPGNSVTLVAGGQDPNILGDGGPATQAHLGNVRGLAFDAQGNLYIADSFRGRVRKVTPQGIISTVAGGGGFGFSGDGGPGVVSRLGATTDVTTDSSGNLYIVDGNQRIRKINTSGIITTIAGNGSPARVLELSGPALATPISPLALAVDASGTIYFTEPSIQRVSRLTTGGRIERIAGTGLPGFNGEHGSALSTQLSHPQDIAVDAAGNVFVSDFGNDRIRRITTQAILPYVAPDRGAVSVRTTGAAASPSVGYARIHGSSIPAGFAIYGVRQNNTLISEASVPASAAVLSGAFYAERSGPVSTGVAIANPNAQAVVVHYQLYANNQVVGLGAVVIPANGQTAAFLDQPPFNQSFSGGAVFVFNCFAPVSVVALRGLTNERGEFLVTTLPVTGITASGVPDLPHFADGAGWTTRITLVNPGISNVSGRIQFWNASGALLESPVIGQTSGEFTYTIPARGFLNLTTPGTAGAARGGRVHLIPNGGSVQGQLDLPYANVLFSYRDHGITVTEGSVTATADGTAFQSYVEVSGNFGAPGSIQSGLAVANTSALSATVSFVLIGADGQSTGIQGSFAVPANGQTSMFVNQLPGVGALPASFQGILRLTSSQLIAVTGIRGRYNERGEFLIAATPAVNESAAAQAGDLFFPHIVDSGGYSTQFILFNTRSNQSSSGSIELFSQTGAALDWAVQ